MRSKSYETNLAQAEKFGLCIGYPWPMSVRISRSR
jgi:hypothetical protein